MAKGISKTDEEIAAEEAQRILMSSWNRKNKT